MITDSTSVATPLMTGPAPARGITAGSVKSAAVVTKAEPGGPGSRTGVAPTPLGMAMECDAGSPDPTCRRSRIIKSMPPRSVLLVLEIIMMVALPFMMSDSPPSVAPMITVRRAIEMSSSMSE